MASPGALVIGDSYKVSAKRGKGYKLVDWAGTVEGLEVFRTNSAKLNFVMQSNLVLAATFVESADAKGSCEKIVGSSIRRPCRRAIGRPCSS